MTSYRQEEVHERDYRVKLTARSHKGRRFRATHREGDRIRGRLTSGRASELYFMAHELENVE